MRDTIRKSSNRYGRKGKPKFHSCQQQRRYVGISLAGYNKLVAERDEVQAKLDKLVGGGSPADNEILLALARHINRVCFKP